MLAAILFSIVGLSFDVIGTPTYDLIAPSVPLANITSLTASSDSCQCGPDCACGRTATSAPVPRLAIETVQEVSCENGMCSVNRANVAPPSTTRQPTYKQDIQYIGKHYQPVKRGLFGRVRGGGSCRGGQCGR